MYIKFGENMLNGLKKQLSSTTSSGSLNNKNTAGTEVNFQKMEKDMQSIIMLMSTTQSSNKLIAELVIYFRKYNRILYSSISHSIFEKIRYSGDFDRGKFFDSINLFLYTTATLLPTLSVDDIYPYVLADCKENNEIINDTDLNKEIDSILKEIPRILTKIWDHIQLAQQQYYTFELASEKATDEKLRDFQKTLSSEMTSQLLSMVGIFTALSFLLFGTISSLENAFSSLSETPILKVMIVACLWGLVLLNTVFVFLYCVGRMCNLTTNESNSNDESFFKRNPLYIWSNFILIALLMVFLCVYVSYYPQILKTILEIINTDIPVLYFQKCFFIISFPILSSFISVIFMKLWNYSNVKNSSSSSVDGTCSSATNEEDNDNAVNTISTQ
ncbi:hypothetical protein IM774_11500 [Erysipelotrichaceae bacterium RD49]|nr:hypothetical protein [Erysipelotrichaceae bacterium RD49]